MKKRCTKCGEIKDITSFHSQLGKRRASCSVCRHKSEKNDPSTEFKRNLKRFYGITPEQYWQQYDIQKGVCAICGLKQLGRNLSVDHNHDTLHVRGLLCGPCNTGIGLLKESTQNLISAMNYLNTNGVWKKSAT